MYWFDDKELPSEIDAISWNSLSKKKKKLLFPLSLRIKCLLVLYKNMLWCNAIDRLLRNFFYGFKEIKINIAFLEAWKDICKPKSWGGVGMRRMPREVVQLKLLDVSHKYIQRLYSPFS